MTAQMKRSLGDIGRDLKRAIAAGEDTDALARELLGLALEVADEPKLSSNRHIVEIPDRFVVARWSRDADAVTIARCILGAIKFEPHTADTGPLRHALMEGVIAGAEQRPRQRSKP
jgi:hypothetical protein